MSSTTNGAGLAHDYIHKLAGDYELAQNCHNEALAAMTKVCDEYQALVSLREAMRGYLKKAEDTKALMNGIKGFLSDFVQYLDSVSIPLLGETQEAVQVLVRSVKCLSYMVEDTRRQIRALFDMVDCLNNPVLTHDASVMKCLAGLLAKTEESVKANLDAIKAVLALLQRIMEMRIHIGDNTLNPPTGLRANLQRLLRIMDCDNCNTRTYDNLYEEATICGDEDALPLGDCELVAPFPVRDLHTPSLCEEDSKYIQRLNDWLVSADDNVAYHACLKKELEERERKSKATMEALKAALEAAKAVKAKCK